MFKEHCAKCHKLFGEGEEIGPDLTTANRKDQEYMLTSIVDPSCFIRVEYLSVQVVTDDGRILAGLVTRGDADPRSRWSTPSRKRPPSPETTSTR